MAPIRSYHTSRVVESSNTEDGKVEVSPAIADLEHDLGEDSSSEQSYISNTFAEQQPIPMGEEPKEKIPFVHIIVYTRVDGELQHNSNTILKEQIARALKHADIKDISHKSHVQVSVFYDICGPDRALTARKG